MNCFIFLGAFQLVAVESFNRNGANSHSVPSQGYVDLAEEAQAAQEALREAVQLKDNLFNKYSKEFPICLGQIYVCVTYVWTYYLGIQYYILWITIKYVQTEFCYGNY